MIKTLRYQVEIMHIMDWTDTGRTDSLRADETEYRMLCRCGAVFYAYSTDEIERITRRHRRSRML